MWGVEKGKLGVRESSRNPTRNIPKLQGSIRRTRWLDSLGLYPMGGAVEDGPLT